MKVTLLLIFSLFLVRTKVSAQQEIKLKDVGKYIGHDVTIYDTVYAYKIINKNVKELYVGGKYPNQKLTIIVKDEPKLDPSLLRGHLCGFIGVVKSNNNRLEIIATDRSQVFGFETSE